VKYDCTAVDIDD